MIGFIGKGAYKEVEYRLNGSVYRSSLAIMPISAEFKPDKIHIIGTAESQWELLKGIDYEKILIPAGNSEKEFWEMMDILSDKIDLSHSEVAFDITHCFRTIPFFVVIFIRFMKFFDETAEIKHIFYANIESKEIIDLKPLLDLLDWIDATSIFLNSGELENLCSLVAKAEREAGPEEKKEKPSQLKNLRKIMKELAAITQMTYVPQFGEISKSLADLMSDKNFELEARNQLKPIYYLMPKIREMLDKFKAESEWETQLKIASWYLENKKPSQALIVLREAIITHQCLKAEKDPYDTKQRSQIEEELNKAVKAESKMDIHRLWDRVSQHRNKVAHALMRRRENIDPEKAIRTTRNYLKEAFEVMTGMTERSHHEN